MEPKHDWTLYRSFLNWKELNVWHWAKKHNIPIRRTRDRSQGLRRLTLYLPKSEYTIIIQDTVVVRQFIEI